MNKTILAIGYYHHGQTIILTGEKMELVTKQSKIDTVAKRWNEQYFYDSEKRWEDVYVKSNKTSEQIYNELLSCKTEREIIDVIGNTSWTENKCDECSHDNEKVIAFDVDGEYTLLLCKNCLEKAIKMIGEK